MAIRPITLVGFIFTLVLALASQLASPRSAHAATFTVDRFDDPAPSTAAASCGAAANDCSLREAVRKANSTTAADVIELADGDYTITRANTTSAGDNTALRGDLDITQPLTIEGAGRDASKDPGRAATTIRAGQLDRIFDIRCSPCSVDIQSLEVRDGRATNQNGGGIRIVAGASVSLSRVKVNETETVMAKNGGTPGHGGGIYNAGALDLTNSIVREGRADGDGGGIYNAANATLTAFNSTVFRNDADNATPALGEGGGLMNLGTATLEDTVLANNNSNNLGGGIANYGYLTMTGGELRDNFASLQGGGVYIQQTLTLFDPSATFLGTVIDSNMASSGGGGYQASPGGLLKLVGATVSRNQAQYGGGVSGSSGIEIEGGTISGNTATNGGGIALPVASSVVDATISGNTASQSGGGVYFGGGTIERSTISDNTAGSFGGGLFVGADGISTNVTFSGNSANAGAGVSGNVDVGYAIVNSTIAFNILIGDSPSVGGIMGNGALTIENTIIDSNDGAECANVESEGGNVADDDTCDWELGSGDDKNGNPMLNPLGDYGGPTFTHTLQPGGSALNWSSTTGCPDIDQRGFTRFKTGNTDSLDHCDAGAVEMQRCFYDAADGNANFETISGTDGNDDIDGTAGPDVIVTYTGDDTIDGLGGDDRLCGRGGSDTLRGGNGEDKLDGGASSDTCNGGSPMTGDEAQNCEIVVNIP
ncbi:MAG: choice-of-anchor Q domain-containing protein [Dehalococcoidia bacterium]